MGELFAKYQERKQLAQQTVPAVAETKELADNVMPAEKAAPISKDPKPALLPQSRGTKRKR